LKCFGDHRRVNAPNNGGKNQITNLLDSELPKQNHGRGS
jgi:hypothetical protein